jgi:hypothetical protein
MRGINLRRVLLGGLLAGLISNVSGLTFVTIFRDDIQPILERIAAPEPTTGRFVLHLGTRFFMGIVVVFLYAAIRPRFGPGPKTAALNGLLIWLIAYIPFAVALDIYGLYTTSQLLKMMVWGLGEVVLISIAGAWVYREGGAS